MCNLEEYEFIYEILFFAADYRDTPLQLYYTYAILVYYKLFD